MLIHTFCLYMGGVERVNVSYVSIFRAILFQEGIKLWVEVSFPFQIKVRFQFLILQSFKVTKC